MMYRVLSVKECSGEIIISLCVPTNKKTNTEKYTISLELYEKIGSPATDEEVSSDIYDLIREKEDYEKAFNHALSFLSYSDKSVKELYRKLVLKNHLPNNAWKAIEKVQELGYLNEEKQIENAIRNMALTQHYGKRYIYEKLHYKGYDDKDVKRVLEKLIGQGEIDFKKEKEFWFKYYKDKMTEEKFKSKLYYLGF